MKIPRAENNVSTEIIAQRVAAVNGMGVDLRHTTHYSLDPANTAGKIENFIGVAQVPIGLAGPIRINGEFAQGDFLVPLATTEGTLVASYNRGMKAISEAGGCRTQVHSDFFMVPYFFRLETLQAAAEFAQWCERHSEVIAGIMEATTRHGRFHGMRLKTVPQGVIIEFEMTTGDAMGANMVVIAADAACKWIAREAPNIDPKDYHLGDMGKKANTSRAVRGFGKNVTAEVRLPMSIMQRLFHTTAKDWMSSYRAFEQHWTTTGAQGYQCMFANGLAALYIACGQDLGYLPEETAGHLGATALPDDSLHVTVHIPCIIIGTVGGGCNLPTQKECLQMLGCFGTGNARKFAEIAASVVLAGELSVVAAFAAREFVQAHQKLSRNCSI